MREASEGLECPGPCRIAKFLALARVTSGHDITSVTALYPSPSNGRPLSKNFRVTLDFPLNPIFGKREYST